MGRQQLTEMERVLKALGDVTRLRILGLLRAGEVCVCHIHESLRIPQPRASRHLAYLRRSGLVSTRRQGLWVYYRLSDAPGPIVSALRQAVARGLAPLDVIRKDAGRLKKKTGCCAPPVTVVERARRADAAGVLQLLDRNQLPADGVADRLATTIVARTDGQQVAGTAALEIYAGDALLRSVAVDPAFRGKGLGHELTEAALLMAQRHGASNVYLLTTTAAAFFPRFGFAEIARGEIPAAVRASVEFTTACPSSATAMRKVLSPRI